MAGIFTASRLQVATYLLGICPFSIAFLVFLNSSVSFVITDLINYDGGVGDAVGSLGFADELLALIACPIWGLLSDRVGIRTVCVLGYAIIGLSLFVFVQARNVYPQLLLGRLFFSLGGAAASTMVTAVLPTMSAEMPALDANPSHSVHAGLVARHTRDASQIATEPETNPGQTDGIKDRPAIETDNSSKIAGLVGMATGCGALIALGVFLPLPARFQNIGLTPGTALQRSYYIVGAIAFIVSLVCLVGLRKASTTPSRPRIASHDAEEAGIKSSLLRPLRMAANRFYHAILAGFVSRKIALGYIGGFVARASSVGISLFIPLLVNAAFSDARLCGIENILDDPHGLPDIKRRCPRAYVVAAELTGVSQLTALICAPVFGYWSSRLSNKAIPLAFAAVTGIVGYPLFSTTFDPHDDNRGQRALSFFAVCLIGVSQIGAIVCSLSILSIGVLQSEAKATSRELATAQHSITDGSTEAEPLLRGVSEQNDRSYANAKGSIAGIYSFYGGAGILILTKAGGALFDSATSSAPFTMMAVFNAIMLLAGLVIGFRDT